MSETLRTAVKPFNDCSSSAPRAGGGVTPMRPSESKPSRTRWLPGGSMAADGAPLLVAEDTRVLCSVAGADQGSGPEPDPDSGPLLLLLLALTRAVARVLQAAAVGGSSSGLIPPGAESRDKREARASLTVAGFEAQLNKQMV